MSTVQGARSIHKNIYLLLLLNIFLTDQTRSPRDERPVARRLNIQHPLLTSS